jgi:ArsR family transcriptional regulator
MKSLADACRLLADPARLRILRLLAQESLCASELVTVLGLSQPAVSRQLGSLRQAGLILERREGAFSYFFLASEPGSEAGFVHGQLAELIAAAPDEIGDRARLEQVLRQRRDQESLPVGGHPDFVPGRSWSAWSRALLHLLDDRLVAVDIGCGDGGLTLELARRCRRVIGVDRDTRVLSRARKRIAAAGAENIELKRGSLDDLPLASGSVGLALLSQVLHHGHDPLGAIVEATRVLAPGGALLIMDLAPHRELWVREKLGDHHLGLAEADLRAWCQQAGLAQIRHEALPRDRGERFQVVVVSARRPQARARRRAR